MFTKISIAHSKIRIPLLNLFINCISARSAPQILSVKDERTFLLLSFLIIGLCNSSANSLLEIFSMSLLKVFFQKIHKPLKQDSSGIHNTLDF